MKYSMDNLNVKAVDQVEFSIDKVEVEYSLEELAQFAMNFKTILDTIKDAVKELTPIISSEIYNAENSRHYHRLEQEQEERKTVEAKRDMYMAHAESVFKTAKANGEKAMG